MTVSKFDDAVFLATRAARGISRHVALCRDTTISQLDRRSLNVDFMIVGSSGNL